VKSRLALVELLEPTVSLDRAIPFVLTGPVKLPLCVAPLTAAVSCIGLASRCRVSGELDQRTIGPQIRSGECPNEIRECDTAI
jgi:hypothetical protein